MRADVAERAAIQASHGIPMDRVTLNYWFNTCGCVHRQWHDILDPANTVDYFSTVRTCPAHAAGGAAKPVWDACNNETARWRRVRELIRDRAGLSFEQMDAQCAFTFTSNYLADGLSRVLDVKVPGAITAPARNNIVATLDAEFEAGAVLVGV